MVFGSKYLIASYFYQQPVNSYQQQLSCQSELISLKKEKEQKPMALGLE